MAFVLSSFICYVLLLFVECSLCYVDFFTQAELETEEILETGSVGIQPRGKAFIKVVKNELSTKELGLVIIF